MLQRDRKKRADWKVWAKRIAWTVVAGVALYCLLWIGAVMSAAKF